MLMLWVTRFSLWLSINYRTRVWLGKRPSRGMSVWISGYWKTDWEVRSTFIIKRRETYSFPEYCRLRPVSRAFIIIRGICWTEVSSSVSKPILSKRKTLHGRSGEISEKITRRSIVWVFREVISVCMRIYWLMKETRWVTTSGMHTCSG